MPDTFNSESKILIRSQWSKKIIKYINKRLNSKLVYLGLPSPDAEDIQEWIEYIDEVIAFQCREYPKPSNPEQSVAEIIKLQNKLSELERKKKISNFVVYDGYLEEVLFKGVDNAGIEFEINNLIHIFNLDFCNSITSPMEILNKNGDIHKVYKFEAIKILLQIQDLLKSNPKKFVLFLTIHSSYFGPELENFSKNYQKEIKHLSKKERNKRILRSYVIENLKDFFRVNNFIPEFLPVIHYTGVDNFQLLHFTVIGTDKKENAGIAPFNQDLEGLIREKFLEINNKNFKKQSINSFKENDIKIDPIKIFESSKTFKLWQI